MQCVLVLNASQNAAICEAKSINIHIKEIGKTFSNHKKHGSKGAKWPLKSGVFVAKSGKLELKNYESATKLERRNGAKRRFCS